MKRAEVRFYFDADVLGVAKIVAALRPDATYPGDAGAVVNKRSRQPSPVTSPRALDREWIPIVAKRRWLIVTRDSHIVQHAAELAAVVDNKAKLVAISGRDGGGTWNQLEIVMTQWRKLEELAELPGPFVYTVTRTALSPVELPKRRRRA